MNEQDNNTNTGQSKVIFSAVQPTGALTIGNYIGAIKNFIKLQDEYKCYYAVADLHSITMPIEPAVLRRNVTQLYAMFLAFGLDPKKSTLFVQSHVSAHAELAWVLNCYTQFGEASRMTQFKDKSKKAADNINVGLFSYPVLMAADILLYQTDFVPVGQDQNQHLELSRDIATRFNNKFSPTFKVPEGIIPKHGARVHSLLEPTAKMSKSDENPNAYILLTDTPEEITRKFKRSVTDSDASIRFDEKDKPGVSNLLTIYSAFTDKTVQESEKEFANFDYAKLKTAVADACIEALRPIQQKYNEALASKDYLVSLMESGANEAQRVAYRTLSKVYRKVGLR